MYDTVHFRLTVGDYGGVSFVEETPCYLADVATHDYNGSIVITGNLQGLRVSVTPWQVKVKDGSLCKWYLGDNLQTMSRGDVQRAIERLSDELHLPMNLATITRLDIGANLITQHPAEVYYNHLGVLAWAKRLVEPSGLYYSKRDERLCFYDKIKEQRSRREAIPDTHRGKNVLRYEQRYIGHLSRVLKVPPIKGATLYDGEFYSYIVSRWEQTYTAIGKINDTNINLNSMGTSRDFDRLCRLAMMERAGGELALIDQINELRKKGVITSKQAHDIRQKIKRAASLKGEIVTPNENIQELDRLIKECIDVQQI